jgi:hypothetical protein
MNRQKKEAKKKAEAEARLRRAKKNMVFGALYGMSGPLTDLHKSIDDLGKPRMASSEEIPREENRFYKVWVDPTGPSPKIDWWVESDFQAAEEKTFKDTYPEGKEDRAPIDDYFMRPENFNHDYTEYNVPPKEEFKANHKGQYYRDHNSNFEWDWGHATDDYQYFWDILFGRTNGSSREPGKSPLRVISYGAEFKAKEIKDHRILERINQAIKLMKTTIC